VLNTILALRAFECKSRVSQVLDLVGLYVGFLLVELVIKGGDVFAIWSEGFKN
jgi:hypothetical protein